ncbi:hypothetical protein DFH06DRAFT_1415974 [Mycena polygramma]|nr:hypothetical protein DFH06DRAFT_1415974 [Mycena polygramma]
MDSYEPSSTTSGTVFGVFKAWIVCWTAIHLIIDWGVSLNAFFTPIFDILVPAVVVFLAAALIVLGLVLLLRLYRGLAEYKTDDAFKEQCYGSQKDVFVVVGYIGMSVLFCSVFVCISLLVLVSVSIYSNLNTSSLAKSSCSSADPDGDDDEGNTTLVANESQDEGPEKENCARDSSPSPPPAYYTISPSTSVTIEPFELSPSTCADSPLYLLSESITDTDFDLDFNIDFCLDDFNFGLSPSTDLAPEPALDLSVVVYVPSPLSIARVPAQDLAPAADDLDLDPAQPAVSADEPSTIAPDAIDLSVVVYVPSPLSTARVPAQDLAPTFEDLDLDLVLPSVFPIAPKPALDLSVVVFVPSPLSNASVSVQDLAPAADDLDLDLAQPDVFSDDLSPIAPDALDLSVVVFVPSPFSTVTVLPQDAVSAPTADDLDLDLSEPVVIPDPTSTDFSPTVLDPAVPMFVPSPSTATLLADDDAVVAPTADDPALGSTQPAVIPDVTSTNISPKSLDPSVPIFVPYPLTTTVLVPDVVLAPTAADDVDLDLGQPKVLNPMVPIFVPSLRSTPAPLLHDAAAASTAHSKIPWTRGGQPTRIAAPRPATLTASVPEFVPRIVPGTTIPSPFAGEVHYRLTPHRSVAPNYWSSRSSGGGPLSIVSPSPSTA